MFEFKFKFEHFVAQYLFLDAGFYTFVSLWMTQQLKRLASQTQEPLRLLQLCHHRENWCLLIIL